MVSSAFNVSNQVDPEEKAAINHKYQQRIPCVFLSGFGYKESVQYKLISSHVKSFSNNFPSWAGKQCSHAHLPGF